eukprot:scaffold28695_cov62-Phaeocystis_antarctica.AAC.6
MPRPYASRIASLRSRKPLSKGRLGSRVSAKAVRVHLRDIQERHASRGELAVILQSPSLAPTSRSSLVSSMFAPSPLTLTRARSARTSLEKRKVCTPNRHASETPSRARQGCPPPQPLMTRCRAPGAVAQALTFPLRPSASISNEQAGPRCDC